MAVDHNNPQSRDEEILIATIDGTEYNKNPQSRMEELLLELKEVIEEGGGGGGTTDYENLSNQPQVNGETLIGDKSGADLGLVDAEEGKGLSTNDYDDTEKAAVAAATSAISAMQDGSDIDSFGDVEVALLDKQDELTAGKYIQFTNDEISVKRDIAYEADEVFFAEQTNEGLHVSVTIGSTTLYDENFVTSDPNHTVLDLVQVSFSVRAVRWIVKYLKSSKTRSAGDEEVVWPSITDTFVTTVDADKKLIIQSEMDAAINSAVSKCYHHAGTKTCAELLPALLIAANEGNVYEMTDSGTTTSDFMEGIGHPIKEGNNVGVARVSEGVYKFDLLSGFVDTSNFVQKSQTAGLFNNDGTVNTTIENTVAGNTTAIEAIDNEVNGDATTYPYADVITIENAVPANLADCSVKIEPVQDLHGYDKPWVGGASDNQLDTSTVTVGNVTFTEDTDGYVSCADGDGRSWSYANCQYKLTLPSGNYKFVVETKTVGSTGKGCVFKDSSGNDILSINSANLFAEVGVVAYDFTLSEETSFGAEIKHGGAVARFMIVSSTVANTWQPYENICPITGHTEVDVQRDGKNMWNGDVFKSGKAIDNTGAEISANNYSLFKYVLPVGNYTVSFADTDKTSEVKIARVGVFNSDDSVANVVSTNTYTSESGRLSLSFSVTDKTQYAIVSLRAVSVVDIQLELGSSATDYEPYQGKTYTIALGSTIYGGTVDFDSGVMTVDRAGVDMGTQTWTYDSTTSTFYASISGIVIPPETVGTPSRILCSIYEVKNAGYNTAYAGQNNVIWQRYTNTQVRVRDSRYTDAGEFTTAMDGVQLCYELATPTTIQLTPQQIQLLKGQNTLTASTGQISVTANGVAGSIGAVQEQVNELAEDVAEIKPLNYSTTEQKTGQKWIDGKDIYSRTWDFESDLVVVGDQWTPTIIDSTGIDMIIVVSGSGSNGSVLPLAADKANNVVRLGSWRDGNVGVRYLTLYYTKTT